MESGERLGFVDDLEFDAKSARILALVLCGQERLWGLLGRESDLVIPFASIRLIGKDAILVADLVGSDSENCAKRTNIKSMIKEKLGSDF